MNVSVTERATVTAGLANEVDEVNQYPAVMYAPTANGSAAGRHLEHPWITARSPKVAMPSLRRRSDPERARCEGEKSGSPNMA